MRENRTHGSIGGRWRHGDDLRGLLVPGRCAEKRHQMAWSGPQPQRMFVEPAAYLTDRPSVI